MTRQHILPLTDEGGFVIVPVSTSSVGGSFCLNAIASTFGLRGEEYEPAFQS